MAVANENTDNIFGRRLAVARRFYGRTLDELAEELALTKMFLSLLERGKRRPGEMLVRAFGYSLAVVPAYFSEPLGDEFRVEDCAFRSLTNTPKHVQKRVLAHGTLFAHMIAALETVLALPPDNVAFLPVRSPDQIEGAAQRTRKLWTLDLDAPLKDLTRMFERNGIVVTSFKGSADQVDAFSRARDGCRKIIVANTDKDSPLRYRWNIAHELGHLVLHRAPYVPNPEQEKEAERFAAAFLLPRSGFVRDFPRPGINGHLNWDGMLRLRRRWGVSVHAIIRRAFDLRLISPVQCQRADKYIYAKRWHQDEPGKFEAERPEIVETMFDALGETEIVDQLGLAKRLHWEPSTLERVSGIAIKRSEVVRLDRQRATRMRPHDVVP